VQVTTTIHLLGAPTINRDGQAVPPPRGNKAWGLLAYLLLADGAVHRTHLCSLLFADADDPLAALRWNLSQLRQVLGDSGVVQGDPVRLELGETVASDVQAVLSGTWREASLVGGLGKDLLGTLQFPACPSFDVWLESERRHVRAASEAILHEGALTRLAAGDGRGAADIASHLVRLNPYEENFQVLLVRSLAASGDGIAAARAAAACRTLFRRELGVEPGPDIDAAAATLTARPTSAPSGGTAAILALLQAGEAAIGAGAVEAGLQCLRRAVSDAEGLSDRGLQAHGLGALGAALVHAVRGRDEEGATALHQAVALSDGDDALTAVLAHACRELGYIEFMRARYDRVEPWLRRAEAAAGDDLDERCRILTVRGESLGDTARYSAALLVLDEAIREGSVDRDRAYAISMAGRIHLLRGDLERARAALTESIGLTERSAWTAFLPWPESQLAEVELARGDVGAARERLERAFALSCHLGDPCWEGASGRGLGLLLAAEGNLEAAIATLADARARSTRVPDGYLWIDTHILEAMCDLAVAHDLPEAAGWVAELSALASRRGMRDHVVRAEIFKARLGQSASLAVAVAMADEIDNPMLQELIAAAS
jgi:DNA-binding SARP family transcriptional activator